MPGKRIVELVAIAAILCGTCAAQNAVQQLPEPDAIGVFYYVDSSAQTLKRLPNEVYARHSGGFRHMTTLIRVAGSTAPFQVSGSDNLSFVFKVFKEEDASRAKLFQFNGKGADREYPLGSWDHNDYMPNTGLPVNIAKYGESSFRITSANPLGPGEYALTLGTTLFTFSVR